MVFNATFHNISAISISYNYFCRSSKTKGGEEGASKQDDLSLILPGVGIIRQDRSSHGVIL
jgi:hypothetical protein